MLIHKLFAAVCLAALALPSSARAETALEKATKAFEAGQYTAVLEATATIPADSADWPRAQYLAGETQLLLGKFTDAQTSFKNVLEKRPKAVPAQIGLARALTGLEKYDEAWALLDRAIAAEPKDVGALTARGVLFTHIDKHDDAKKDLAEAMRLDPKNALTVRAAADFFIKIHDYAEASRVAAAFIEARTDHPLGYFLEAVVLEQQEKDAEAIARYQVALEKDPNYLDAHKNLAILCHTLSNTYKDKERTKLAYEHYKRYFELGGTDPNLKAMYDQLLQYKDQIMGS